MDVLVFSFVFDQHVAVIQHVHVGDGLSLFQVKFFISRILKPDADCRASVACRRGEPHLSCPSCTLRSFQSSLPVHYSFQLSDWLLYLLDLASIRSIGGT